MAASLQFVATHMRYCVDRVSGKNGRGNNGRRGAGQWMYVFDVFTLRYKLIAHVLMGTGCTQNSHNAEALCGPGVFVPRVGKRVGLRDPLGKCVCVCVCVQPDENTFVSVGQEDKTAQVKPRCGDGSCG